MAALQCEICGGKLIGKPGGVFECDSCGMEYSTEWAKAKIQEIRGTVQVEGTVEVTGTVKVEGGANKESLLKRGYLLLEDGDWKGADECFDQVLNIDPECAEAYVGKFCATFKFPNLEQMSKSLQVKKLTADRNYQKSIQFGSKELKEKLDAYLASAKEHLASEKKARTYQTLCRQIETAESSEEYNKLIEQFQALGSYKESKAKIILCREQAKAWAAKEDKEQAEEKREWLRFENGMRVLAAGKNLAAGVKADGTVVLAGKTDGLSEVSSWRDIVAVATGDNHVVGLKEDGTVVAAGSNDDGQCDVSEWQDIAAIAAGKKHTVGLKRNGTVVAVGRNSDRQCEVSKWRDVMAIAAGGNRTLVLQKNRKVAWVFPTLNPPFFYEMGVQEIAVSANGNLAAAVCIDGRAKVDTANTMDAQSNLPGGWVMGSKVSCMSGENKVGHWSDIIKIDMGEQHTVGLKKDGTVMAVGANTGFYAGQINVSRWKDIVGIAAGNTYTLGLRSDGTVVGTGGKKPIINKASKWKLFDNIDTLEEERIRAKQKPQTGGEETAGPTVGGNNRAAMESERTALQNELANLKGLFSGKRRKEIEARLAAIAKELEE